MRFLTALIFSFFVTVTQAKETVTIIYAWSAADAAANFHRQLALEANRIQDRFNFVFDTRPGAGGSIAANYVLNTPNHILATASAFYIRPNFFPTESHDLNRFRGLFPACSAPAVISSKRYRNWSEVPTNTRLTIGMSGLGTTTHLIAYQLTKKFPQLTIVPFKSTTEALMAVVNETTDFSVNFLGDSAQYLEGKNRVYQLGVTGNQTVNGIVPLSQQGFTRDLELMNVPAQLVVPLTTSDAKVKELRDIFVRAGRANTVAEAYKMDYCQSINQMPDSEIASWYARQVSDWRRLTQGIRLE
jgi:tripartite-type tricarboxylate transporter receptor subunit TctC